LFLPRIFTETSESIDENLWKSVQSVAENAVYFVSLCLGGKGRE